jgi:drug/metabolite transporter (DMT)-like permease
MPTGLVYGLLAALGWGLVDVTAAVSARTMGSLRVLVGMQAVSVVALVGVAILWPGLLGASPLVGIGAGLPLGVFAALVYLMYFTALRIGPLSIVSPVIMAYGGLTVVLAVAIRGETLSAQQALGAAIASGGVVLAGIVFESRSLRGVRIVGPGVVAALVTMVGFAVLGIGLASPVRDHGWLPVILGSRIGNSLGALAILVVALRSGSPRFGPLLEPGGRWTRFMIAVVVVGGLCDIGGFVAFAVGLEVAQVWLVGLASSFGPVLAVGYAIWRLGERPHPTQWAGLGPIRPLTHRTCVLLLDVRWHAHPTSPRHSRPSRHAGEPPHRAAAETWAW